MHPFLKVLILSQEFYKSKKKKNCAHLIPTQGSYFKIFFRRNKGQEKKKNDKKSEGSGVERKGKGKVKTAVSLLNPKTISKFCFLRMCKIHELMNWTKGSQLSLRPLETRLGLRSTLPSLGFAVNFLFLNEKMARLASKADFRRNSQGRMGQARRMCILFLGLIPALGMIWIIKNVRESFVALDL